MFALVGLGMASTVAFTVIGISRQYHVSVRNAGPDFREVMEMFAYLSAVPLALGVSGIITGRGLLRLRPKARISVIVWAIGSTLASLYLLWHPAFKSGFHPSATAITLLMLFLFPVNAWWLLLFCRASTREFFGASGVAAQSTEISDWLAKDRLARSVILIMAVLALAGGGLWMYRRNSSMKDMARTRDALAAVKSWHFHTVRYIPDLPPETIDMDTVCPAFQHRTATYEDAGGALHTRESVYYFGSYYGLVDGQWQLGKQQTGFVDPGIFECNNGPTGGDENSLPIPGVIEDGSVTRGAVIGLNGDSCREYAVSVPTPHDPKENEFQFTICINEQDHLPRETRRTPPGATHEGVSRFSQWNAMSEPQRPPDP